MIKPLKGIGKIITSMLYENTNFKFIATQVFCYDSS